MPAIFPIVEGHGEVSAVPEIVRKISYERENIFDCNVFKPYRMSRGKIVRFGDDLDKVIRYGEAKIASDGVDGGILILVDSDDDCPVVLQRKFMKFFGRGNYRVPVSFVLPKREYEAWFISCVEHMRTHPSVRDDAISHPDPESLRDAKGFFSKDVLIDGVNYSETIDQVRYSSIINVECVFERCRSFQKFCNEVGRILAP